MTTTTRQLTSSETCPHFLSSTVIENTLSITKTYMINSLCVRKKDNSIFRGLIALTSLDRENVNTRKRKRNNKAKKPQLHIPTLCVPNINISFSFHVSYNERQSALTTQHIFAILLSRLWLVVSHHPIFRCTHSREWNSPRYKMCVRTWKLYWCARIFRFLGKNVNESRDFLAEIFLLSISWMKLFWGEAHVNFAIFWASEDLLNQHFFVFTI